jgi:beta-lactamase class A
VDAGRERLDRVLDVPTETLSWSPVTETHRGGRVSVAQLCEATITVSDNTAANLLLATLGGPAGLTAFLRRIGDDVTRLDRTETALNLPASDRRWDTTSPIAMASNVGTLLFGRVLGDASRAQLRTWTAKTSTGMQRLRAALPADWPQGDKTGTGPTHTNDVGWFQPPGQAPWIVAAYLADARGDAATQNAILASVGRAVVELLHDTPETIKAS